MAELHHQGVLLTDVPGKVQVFPHLPKFVTPSSNLPQNLQNSPPLLFLQVVLSIMFNNLVIR